MTSSDGSTEFQQIMLNYLGDRDYDSFEYNELNHLKQKIGFALFGPPTKLRGYGDQQKTQITFIYNTILTENNLISKWKDRILISVIYNCLEPLPEEKERRAREYSDYRPEYDLYPIPIFVLRKCKRSPYPCRVFIDNTGRVYQTWRKYLTKNKLPKCNMVVPLNGKYMEGPNGEVLLEKHLSPACNPSTEILQRTNILHAVLSLGSLGIFGVGVILVACPLLVWRATAAVYGYTSEQSNQELISFSNSQARVAYLNILAGTLGFVGDSTSMAMSQLAAQGVNIGTLARTTIDELTILQLSSSILFFGHAVYNFQTTNTLTRESQANSLRDIQESLQSNGQRRTFNKLLKETIRQNDGNVQQGQAQVIKSIRSMDGNQDKVIATLTRWNKTFNKNKVRFAVQDGKVTLNGVVVDINEFGNMDRRQGLTYLGKLQGKTKLTQSDRRAVSSMIRDAFNEVEFEEIGRFAIRILNILGNGDMTINQKIINAVASIINTLLEDRLSNNYMGVLDDIFPHNAKYFKLIGFVSGYFQKLVDEVEKKYQQWYATKDSSLEKPYFIGLSLDSIKRATEIFNFVTQAYYVGTNLTKYGLNLLLTYFYIWFAEQYDQYQENQRRREERIKHSNSLRAPQVRCPTCSGVYYDRMALHQN